MSGELEVANSIERHVLRAWYQVFIAARDNAAELLAVHLDSHGLTTVKNRGIAEMYRDQSNQARYAIEYLDGLELFQDPISGPYGCRCTTLVQRMTGSGCEICNPKSADELSGD